MSLLTLALSPSKVSAAESRQTTNHPPKVFWHRVPQAHGGVRHFLWIDEKQTPYFIDVAPSIGHYHDGHKVGLLGSGMGNAIRRRDGSSYRIAALLGAFDTIGPAKARAARLALSD